MFELFWQSKINRQAKKTLRALPDLPSDIDDNVFIALGTQAAEADKKSNAYDEFLFSEEGYEQMPYEDSIDEILSLQRSRTPERSGRATLPIKLRVEHLEKVVEANQKRVQEKARRLESLEKQVEDELGYLSATKKGEDGGYWEGVAPDITSRFKHVSNLLKEWLVFILVASADAAIVAYTLRPILGGWLESLTFAAPAIGVQILFPHLTGKAIAGYRANPAENKRDFNLALAIGSAWLMYVMGMTILRITFLQTQYPEVNNDLPMPTIIWWAALIFSFLILVGLGIWVLVRSIHHNPHKSRFSRLKFALFAMERSVRKREEKLKKSEVRLQAEKMKFDFVASQWAERLASYDQVSESAKSVYRRALVNQIGNPDFTTEYLPDSKFSLRKSRSANRG